MFIELIASSASKDAETTSEANLEGGNTALIRRDEQAVARILAKQIRNLDESNYDLSRINEV